MPVSYEVAAAEWVEGRWVHRESVSFSTDQHSNLADVGAAAMVDGLVVVWGDYNDDVGPAQILERNGTWSSAPAMPLNAGIGHPGSIQLDRSVLALTEKSAVAIFDMDTRSWSVHQTPSSSATGSFWLGQAQSVWTGEELLTWNGAVMVSWLPPE